MQKMRVSLLFQFSRGYQVYDRRLANDSTVKKLFSARAWKKSIVIQKNFSRKLSSLKAKLRICENYAMSELPSQQYDWYILAFETE